ncbi:hypothetical protein CLV62_104114 [Dysgonomonas alginatilytica]|uniref:Uncharacterized protein n=1 Tax=Dysgonomonas alginatilytica TaxID=1605892 RepID=A0A2V3PTA5_9BACT|nr:hypothetical protein [Dysgonomonas alginatilytica]PXV66853.1 hypothetical protein CLV62_104114 [Dysgonomonas alginatilytica]
MSNKPNNFKSKNDKSTQIGNFIIKFEKGQKLRSVKITTVNGNWSISFREDNPLFIWISNEIKTEEGQNILHLEFAAYYAVCNGVPDSIFIEEIIQAYKSSVDRIMQAQKSISEEADQAIIMEEKEKYQSNN